MNDMHNNGYNGQNLFMKENPEGFQGRVQEFQVARYDNVANVKPINCDETMNITSISDLHAYGQGQVVRFPDFAEGQPFVARVRRPSMLVLAKMGKIPNSLLHTAGELFAKGGAGLDTDNKNMLSEFYDTCKIICEAALLQPTMADIESAGIALSDDQLMAIFNYTQTGVKALQSFRKK